MQPPTVQTLNLNCKLVQTTHSGGSLIADIGTALSLLYIPLLMIAGVLAIPWLLVAGLVMRWRERAFRSQMKVLQRTMEWSEFARAMAEGRGTFIEECRGFALSKRWWWTADNAYEQCPYPTLDWETMWDESFRPVAEWFHHRYTSPSTGRGLLVALEDVPKSEIDSFKSNVKSENSKSRWIEVVHPKGLLRKRRRKGTGDDLDA